MISTIQKILCLYHRQAILSRGMTREKKRSRPPTNNDNSVYDEFIHRNNALDTTKSSK